MITRHNMEARPRHSTMPHLFGKSILWAGLCFCFGTRLMATGMYGHSFSAVLQGDTLSVRLQADFVFGAGIVCPHLTWDCSPSGDTVHFRAFYFIGGTWPWAGCTRIDTVNMAWPETDPCVLAVQFFETNGLDTTAVDSAESSWICSLAVPELPASSFLAFPDPFVDHVELVWEGPWPEMADFLLTDALGRVVYQERRAARKGVRLQFPQNLAPGNYLLRANSDRVFHSVLLHRARP